jgi:hypothetical protein
MDFGTDIHLAQGLANIGKDSFTALPGIRFTEYIDTHVQILSDKYDLFCKLYDFKLKRQEFSHAFCFGFETPAIISAAACQGTLLFCFIA